MSGLRTSVFKAGLEALYMTGAHRMLRPLTGGVGAVLMLHHVRPRRDRDFAPNALLEVTPDYLERVIERVRHSGFDIVPMDEVPGRIALGAESRPFVTFTFDDGYRDNAEFAHPILRKHGVPYTIYLPTAFMEHRGELWWVALEEAIRSQASLTATVAGKEMTFDCSTAALKQETFDKIYWGLRALPETELRASIGDLAARVGVHMTDICRDLCMDWNEVRALAADPLVTFGAHTVDHLMLAKYPEETVRHQMAASKARIEAELGRPVRHFAYPVGDPTSAGPRDFAIAAETGFETAVTTRPGVVFPEHAGHMMALPRVSLNGNFQSLRYLDVLLSGAAFAFFNRFRRVNAA